MTNICKIIWFTGMSGVGKTFYTNYLKKQFSSKKDFDKLYEVKSEDKEKKETPQF